MDWRALPRPYRRTGKVVNCLNCGKAVYRQRWQFTKYPHSFCSIVCACLFKGRANRKWDINFSLLDQWTPELGYLIGLLITDGCVRENGQTNFVSKDKELSEFVRDAITPSKPLREERTRINNPVWRWEVWSIPLVNKLRQLCIRPRKSLTGTFPTIPETPPPTAPLS